MLPRPANKLKLNVPITLADTVNIILIAAAFLADFGKAYLGICLIIRRSIKLHFRTAHKVCINPYGRIIGNLEYKGLRSCV